MGYCIDPTALPKDGPHLGPEHPAALRQRSSVLAIKPFNITSQGPVPTERDTDLTEEDRLTYCRSQMIMHNLVRAVDSAEHTARMKGNNFLGGEEDVEAERCKVDFPVVLERRWTG